jgi:hypothetical protein
MTRLHVIPHPRSGRSTSSRQGIHWPEEETVRVSVTCAALEITDLTVAYRTAAPPKSVMSGKQFCKNHLQERR